MKLRPIHNKIIVKPKENEKQTESGLVLMSKDEGVIEGEVLAVGPGKYDDSGKFINVAVNVGDRVLYNKGAGYAVELEKEEYKVLVDEDIVTVIV